MSVRQKVDLGGLRLAYRALGPADAPPLDEPDPAWLKLLGRITAETLVIAGGPRSHLPQESVAELATRIPGARLTTIDAGHLVHATAPEAFLAAVVPFLQPGQSA